MVDESVDNLNSTGDSKGNFWKGFFIASFAPIISFICVILTIDMQITDYPALNKFFGGDDLFIFSLMSLLASLIAWPIIGFSLRPPYQEGGRASAKLGLVGGGLMFLYGLILMSYVGAS